MHSRPGLRGSVLLCLAFVLAGCGEPTGTDLAASVDPLQAFDRSPNADIAQTLNALRVRTSKWHDMDVAAADDYTFMIGCIDERVVEGVNGDIARGMGYHPANLGLFDDQVDLLNPETLVYGRGENGQMRLAAFDYFIPASNTWPSPEDGGTPPSLDELGLPFTWSPVHGGWMFHIWLWWHNPDGMFANFNPTVPLCDCQLDPQTGACTP